MMTSIVQFAYLVASILFIFALHFMTHPPPRPWWGYLA
jgi:NAD/NADP transhydrogenase beta subunit